MKKKPLRNSDSLYDYIDAPESDYLYTSASQIQDAGEGLYTVIPIWKDEVISIFEGEIIAPEEARKRESAGEYRYFINLPDGNTLDAMHVPGFAKYANDASGLEKTLFKYNAAIALDDQHNVCLVATKNIKAGEEIFVRYGKAYWKNFRKK